MLVLSRTINQEIIIGDGIRIKIVGVKGGQIRVGVSAPRDVSVRRLELDEKVVFQKPEVAAMPS